MQKTSELFASEQAPTLLMKAWASLATHLTHPHKARPVVESNGNGQQGDEWTYLRWKVAIGPRPTTLPWSQVP